MQRAIKIFALVAALVLIASFFWRDAESVAGSPPSVRPQSIEQPGISSPAETEGRPSSMPPVAQQQGQHISPPQADTTRAPSPAEIEVLTMYDEMVTVFHSQSGNCAKMAQAVRLVVDSHEPALVKLSKERAALPRDEYIAAQNRLASKEGARLDALREAVEQGVAQCKHEGGLLNELKRLAVIGPEQ